MPKTNALRKRKSVQDGFTLIEFAISMIVLALFVAAAIPLYTLYLKEKAAKITKDNQAAIYYALLDYKERLSEYPCPSSLTAVPGNASYGMAAACPLTALAPGLCANGLCAESGPVLITLDDGSQTTARVIRGAVPFRALNLAEDQAYDGYGRRFFYAVTERLTDSTLFDENHGGIQVVDANGVSLTNATPGQGGTHFLVVSGGEKGEGFYSRGGQVFGNCRVGTLEGENCDTTPQAIYRVSSKNAAGNNQDFDDFVVYNAIREPVLWKYNKISPADVSDRTKGGVGIGMVPQAGQKLAVNGDIKLDIQTGAAKMQGTQYCEQGTSDCFTANLLYDGAGTNCQGEYMVGFQNGKIDCDPDPLNGCDASKGEYIIGFDSAGLIDCGKLTVPKKDCQPKSVSICSTTGMLPLTNDGGTASVSFNSRIETYTCSDGTWAKTSTKGSCTCTPGPTGSVTTNTKYCTQQGLIGSHVTQNVVSCNPYQVTTVVISTCTVPLPCPADTRVVCAGTPQAATASLPSSAHGTKVTVGPFGYNRKEGFMCNNGNWDSISSSGTCEAPLNCPATTQNVCNIAKSIPSGKHGATVTFQEGYDRAEQYKCNNGVWGLSTSSGQCTPPANCTATNVTECSQSVPLPAGNNKDVFASPKFNSAYRCDAGTWTQTKAPDCPIVKVCTWDILQQGYNTGSQGVLVGSECDVSEEGQTSMCKKQEGQVFRQSKCHCVCQAKN